MNYKLPTLNFAYNALEPYFDAKTMEIHYTKHHQAYVNNLNAALEKFPSYADLPVVKLLLEFKSLPEELKLAVRNNGGGHFNHSLFWETLTPKKQDEVPSDLLNQIKKDFGSLDNFKAKFEAAAKSRFGSGWAWLVYNSEDKLEVFSTPNQDSPLMEYKIPLLGLDVWEHSYYLHYQNRRPEYVAAFWNLVNWKVVDQKFSQAKGAYQKYIEGCGCA